MADISVVVPNYNGGKELVKCVDSLIAQNQKNQLIVVDNASTDESIELLRKYKKVEVIKNSRNLGFSGGVNLGIKRAIDSGAQYIALINNDAVARPDWLGKLVGVLEKNPQAGVVTSKIISSSGEYLDSTGEFYTIWGLTYPRGRREADLDKYDSGKNVFGASGGASLYRVEMLKEIGLFDEDFFAYYEDVDLSFRARLAGWKVLYEPSAIVHHHIGATSARLPGFATYQTLKNLPMLYLKNMPAKLFWKNIFRFKLAYLSIFFSALGRGQFGPALRGLVAILVLLPQKLVQRWQIQKGRKLSTAEMDELIIHDLPPNATKLRQLRASWWKLTGKKHA